MESTCGRAVARMSKLFSNTHLLGELHGHAPAMKIFGALRLLLRPFLSTHTVLSVLPVCSLNIHMNVIAHANNWSLTLAGAPVNFIWAQARVCLGVATPLVTTPCNYTYHSSLQLFPTATMLGWTTWREAWLQPTSCHYCNHNGGSRWLCDFQRFR